MGEMKSEDKCDVLPMEMRGGLETLKNIPNRILTLVWKIIGWKGLMVGLTVVLIYSDKFPNGAAAYIWAFVFLVILFGREGLKWIEKLQK